VITDNLIAEHKAKPMIIVMDNLNAVRPGESAALYGARGTLTHGVTATGRRGRWSRARRGAGAARQQRLHRR
jgi:hypothetical protein